MPTSRIEVFTERSGPLFDGAAERAVYEWLDEVKLEVGHIGADWIKIEALAFDKSGRGGTGRAAEAVTVTPFGAFNDVRIFGGMIAGEVWWPWLEGISRRNASTKFPGYHTFRRTRLRLRRYAPELAQKRLEEYITRMGGTVT